jgi:hypothetical protein
MNLTTNSDASTRPVLHGPSRPQGSGGSFFANSTIRFFCAHSVQSYSNAGVRGRNPLKTPCHSGACRAPFPKFDCNLFSATPAFFAHIQAGVQPSGWETGSELISGAGVGNPATPAFLYIQRLRPRCSCATAAETLSGRVVRGAYAKSTREQATTVSDRGCESRRAQSYSNAGVQPSGWETGSALISGAGVGNPATPASFFFTSPGGVS